MGTEVIVAVISGVFSVLAITITSLVSSKNLDIKLDKQQAVFEAIVTERLDNLRKQVEKHNNVLDQMAEVRQTIALQGQTLQMHDVRLDKIEERK